MLILEQSEDQQLRIGRRRRIRRSNAAMIGLQFQTTSNPQAGSILFQKEHDVTIPLRRGAASQISSFFADEHEC